MLEHQELLLRKLLSPERALEGTAAASAWALLDAATGRPVGLVRWQQPQDGSWLSWLSWPALTVHEVEDEPLVFTVQRLWALVPRWEVCDADGHRVAIVRGEWVLDRFGDCLAWRQQTGDGDRYCGRDGRELAGLRLSGDDRLLNFAAEVRGEPFIKMAILAAVLTAPGRA